MKNIKQFTASLSLFAILSLVVGCATQDAYDIRPDAADDGIPTAVAWQNENNDALAAATKCDVLAGFVASDAAADALLAQLKGAYATDPVVMTQIGNLSHFVLCTKCDKAKAGRKVWVAALKRKMAAATDDYVKTFCQQQLWVCEPR